MPNSLQRVAAGMEIPGSKNLFVQLDDEDEDDENWGQFDGEEDEDDYLLDDGNDDEF